MEEHPAKSCWLNANRMSVKSKERDRFVPYRFFREDPSRERKKLTTANLNERLSPTLKKE